MLTPINPPFSSFNARCKRALSVPNNSIKSPCGLGRSASLRAPYGWRYAKERNIEMIEEIFAISDDVRYVAIYRDGQLESKSKENTQSASSSESDRYEELLVNPTLLKLAAQRGNIDCGGLAYLLVRYGNFFQFILPAPWGHVSVCIDKRVDPIAIGLKVKSLLKNVANIA